MIVCHCRQLTDAHVRRAVRDGARTLGDLGRACGAGEECGGCRPELSRLIAVSTVRARRGRMLAGMLATAGAACMPVSVSGTAPTAVASAETTETVGSGC